MNTFFYLLIGAFLGSILETLWCRFFRGRWEFRKFTVIGPFFPLYGLTLALIYVLVNTLNIHSLLLLFFTGFLFVGAIEYFASLFQERILGTKSWDYRHHLFNIQGRTCLWYMILWGISTCLYVQFLLPAFDWIYNGITSFEFTNILLWVTETFFMIDWFISLVARIRRKERHFGLAPRNKIGCWLDKIYPDEKMRSILCEEKWTDEILVENMQSTNTSSFHSVKKCFLKE